MIRPGNVEVRREGNDVVLTYLSMVGHSLEAVGRASADAEVVDLHWLDRATEAMGRRAAQLAMEAITSISSSSRP